jgi:hypothetical protein
MKIKIIYISILIVFALNSCDGYLEVDEVGKSSIPVFFADMDGVRAAVPGAYSLLYSYYDFGFMLYPDAAGDMLRMNVVGADTKMINEYNYNATPEDEITPVGRIWRDAYEALANVNNILEYHPDLVNEFPQDVDELAAIKAETLFMRALIHFDLVRVYAQPYNFTSDASHLGIPVLLRTPAPDDNEPRSTVEETYFQIEEDLQEALELFEITTFEAQNNYRASRLAVLSLLARVSLYKENWSDAVDYATQVINEKSLSQGQDYLDMFNTVRANDETIFRLSGKLKSSAVGQFYNTTNPTGFADSKLVSLLDSEPEGLRLQLLKREEGDPTAFTLKYYKPGVDVGDVQHDMLVFRVSEMYLIRAEANASLNNLEAAKEDIKTLQARAQQKTVEEIDILESTTPSLLALIANERAKELCFEGHRLFDLTRTKQDMVRSSDTNAGVSTVTYPDYRFALPIPQTELNANTNIIQNPGYEN